MLREIPHLILKIRGTLLILLDRVALRTIPQPRRLAWAGLFNMSTG